VWVGFNRTPAFAESATCGVSRVISGEACGGLVAMRGPCAASSVRLTIRDPFHSQKGLQLGIFFT
jgi:hypothetical protein